MDRISALLPEARYVHIIRDGRDVMLSVRPLWFRPGDSVEACAEDWATRLARTRELAWQPTTSRSAMRPGTRAGGDAPVDLPFRRPRLRARDAGVPSPRSGASR